MKIQNRLNRLEAVTNFDELPAIEIVLCNSSEQVKHPEWFRKVLVKEQLKKNENTATVRHFRLERKDF